MMVISRAANHRSIKLAAVCYVLLNTFNAGNSSKGLLLAK